MTKVKPLKQEQYKSQAGNEYVFQQPKNSKVLEIIDATEINSRGLVMASSLVHKTLPSMNWNYKK